MNEILRRNDPQEIRQALEQSLMDQWALIEALKTHSTDIRCMSELVKHQPDLNSLIYYAQNLLK